MTTSSTLSLTPSPRNARRAAAYAAGKRDGASDVETRLQEEAQALEEAWHLDHLDHPTAEAPDFDALARAEVASWPQGGWEVAAISAGAHRSDEAGRHNRTAYYRGYDRAARAAHRAL